MLDNVGTNEFVITVASQRHILVSLGFHIFPIETTEPFGTKLYVNWLVLNRVLFCLSCHLGNQQ